MCPEPLNTCRAAGNGETEYRRPGKLVLLLLSVVGALYMLCMLVAPVIALVILAIIVCVRVFNRMRRGGARGAAAVDQVDNQAPTDAPGQV